ncbi:hypothetical protein Tsubulata_035878 [Turnera subulata]|uniref:Exostosin GT47 domain-containing protein n=1 Tax=Turnera subulata TaxID=218843 RepID=A0A9Q0GJH4_9ROSI|nr:hypothetical protein Tsubulata_035878 [Turnera subulata]
MKTNLGLYFVQVPPLKESDIAPVILLYAEKFMHKYAVMEKQNLKVFVYPDEEEDEHQDYCHQSLEFNGMQLNDNSTRILESLNSLLKIPERLTCSLFQLGVTTNAETSNATVLASVKNVLSNYPYWLPNSGGFNHFWMTCDGYDGNSMDAFYEYSPWMFSSLRVVSWPSMDGEYEYSPLLVFLPPVMGLPFGSPPTAYHNKRRVSLQGRLRLLLARDAKMNMSSDREMLAYVEKLYTSKFCLCRGLALSGPACAEAIQYGCVPVILYSKGDLPLSETLRWGRFAVFFDVKYRLTLRILLKRISHPEYKFLHRNLIKGSEAPTLEFTSSQTWRISYGDLQQHHNHPPQDDHPLIALQQSRSAPTTQRMQRSLAYRARMPTPNFYRRASSAQNQGPIQGVQQTRDSLLLAIPNVPLPIPNSLPLPIPNGLSVPTPSSFAIARVALQITIAGGATEGVEDPIGVEEVDLITHIIASDCNDLVATKGAIVSNLTKSKSRALTSDANRTVQGRIANLEAMCAPLQGFDGSNIVVYVVHSEMLCFVFGTLAVHVPQNQGPSQGVQQTRDPLPLPIPNLPLLIPNLPLLIPNGLSVPTPSSFAIARAALQFTIGGATEGVEDPTGVEEVDLIAHSK